MPVFKVSENPEKLFELMPGSHLEDPEVHINETKYITRIIDINSLGFRDIERNISKSKNVTRIIFIGSSNTFGGSVSSNDTFPNLMETALNKPDAKTYEVWNAGVHAYVLSQKVAYANEIIEKYDPDIIIFEEFPRGRRAFLSRSDYYQFFKKNKELYFENIPNFSPSISDSAHFDLLEKSKHYRIISIIRANFALLQCNKDSECLRKLDQKYFSKYGEYRNKIAMDEFLINHKNIPIIVWDNLKNNYCENAPNHDNVYFISLCFQNLSPEYYDAHPPSYVYKEYAQRIIKNLKELKLIK
ncbi:MAG: SGNH/GDSL hydrolase family protein [archaeon]